MLTYKSTRSPAYPTIEFSGILELQHSENHMGKNPFAGKKPVDPKAAGKGAKMAPPFVKKAGMPRKSGNR